MEQHEVVGRIGLIWIVNLGSSRDSSKYKVQEVQSTKLRVQPYRARTVGVADYFTPRPKRVEDLYNTVLVRGQAS